MLLNSCQIHTHGQEVAGLEYRHVGTGQTYTIADESGTPTGGWPAACWRQPTGRALTQKRWR